MNHHSYYSKTDLLHVWKCNLQNWYRKRPFSIAENAYVPITPKYRKKKIIQRARLSWEANVWHFARRTFHIQVNHCYQNIIFNKKYLIKYTKKNKKLPRLKKVYKKKGNYTVPGRGTRPHVHIQGTEVQQSCFFRGVTNKASWFGFLNMQW